MKIYTKYLMQEGKATISPHLKSVIKKIDTIDMATATKITKALDKAKLDVEKVFVSTSSVSDDPYVGIFTQDRKYNNKDEIIANVSKALKTVGKKVTTNKIASQQLFIYFI